MLDRIENFLTANDTPELVALVTRADRIVQDYGFNNYDIYLLNHLSRLESHYTDESTTVAAIVTTYKEILLHILHTHHITLDDVVTDNDNNLEDICIITDALKQCQFLELGQPVIDIIRSDDDDVSKLCKIFEMTCAYDVEWFMLRIANIHPNTLSMLSELYMNKASLENLEEQGDLDIKRDHHLHLLKQFMLYLKVDEINVSRLVKDGMGLHLGIDTYMELIDPYLYILPERNIGVELYAAALIARPDKPVVALIEPYISKYSVDTQQAGRLLKLIRYIDVEFTRVLKEHQQTTLGNPRG